MLIAFPRLLHGLRKPALRGDASLTELHRVRAALLACLDDCDGHDAMRLTVRITQARSHKDLWQLRSDVFKAVSLRHCQSLAAERIEAVLHHFEGWIDPQELRQPLLSARPRRLISRVA
jgi:hypothetical protein